METVPGAAACPPVRAHTRRAASRSCSAAKDASDHDENLGLSLPGADRTHPDIPPLYRRRGRTFFDNPGQPTLLGIRGTLYRVTHGPRKRLLFEPILYKRLYKGRT